MVHETGVSYYGCTQADHAREDFKEMVDHNCNAVQFAISEFDCQHWWPAMKEITKIAKNEFGLRVHVSLWGFGRVFGGEPISAFLEEHADYRQVTSASGKLRPAACINTEFRKYYLTWVKSFLRDLTWDYLFQDEPHYAVPTSSEWTCRCETCQQLFKQKYGYEMPKELTDDVRKFREQNLVALLVEAARLIKSTDSSKKVITCLLPGGGEQSGIGDWSRIASAQEIDVLSTDPYPYVFGKPAMRPYVTEITKKALKYCKDYSKMSQIWVQLFSVPAVRTEEVKETIKLIDELDLDGKKVDSIFCWSYRATKGTTISCTRPDLAWKLVGEAFREVLEK
ncbi:MAG: hypothetical protein WED05_06905 [Candidatus Atabeyarchaeum deiterrae]